MGARTWISLASLVVLGGVNLYLLLRENVDYFDQVRVDDEGAVIMQASDKLLELRYLPQNREANFEAFGMDEGLVRQTLLKTRRLDEKFKDRIGVLLEGAGDVDALADALCGEATGLRPRYGALRYLVEEDGRRRVVDLQRISSFDWQDWSRQSNIQGVYVEVELVDEPEPNATLMGISAILLGREQEVIDHLAPWGRSIGAAWSWSRVMRENPQISEVAVNYFATMHLVVELAQAEGGICN